MLQQTLKGLRALGAIAANTFREAIRNKILGALVLFAVGFIAFGLVLGAMSLHHEVRVVSNVSLFGTTLFATVLTIYVSINLFHNEIERRTIYTILSKPIHRWQFLIGKFLGILSLAGLIIVLLFGVACGLRIYEGGAITPQFGWGFVLIFFQTIIVAAVSLLFASFSTPLLSGLLSAAVFLLGHLHTQLTAITDFFQARLLRKTLEAFAFILPNLSSMNLSTEITHDISLPASYIYHAGWYTLSYTGLVLLVTVAIFSRRDLL